MLATLQGQQHKEHLTTQSSWFLLQSTSYNYCCCCCCCCFDSVNMLFTGSSTWHMTTRQNNKNKTEETPRSWRQDRAIEQAIVVCERERASATTTSILLLTCERLCGPQTTTKKREKFFHFGVKICKHQYKSCHQGACECEWKWEKRVNI